MVIIQLSEYMEIHDSTLHLCMVGILHLMKKLFETIMYIFIQWNINKEVEINNVHFMH